MMTPRRSRLVVVLVVMILVADVGVRDGDVVGRSRGYGAVVGARLGEHGEQEHAGDDQG